MLFSIKNHRYAEVDVVENAQKYLNEKIKSGEFVLPAGVSYVFTGNYENQIRATKRLMLVVPISLILIFLILYFQFNSVTISVMVFSGILVAFSGGFLMIWLYGQPWFLNFSVGGINIHEMFQMHTINLSVAVWVGFIALFGIATDDGVIVGTYLMQIFEKDKPGDYSVSTQSMPGSRKQKSKTGNHDYCRSIYCTFTGYDINR